MKLHIITVGKPKLPYAQSGWEEYWNRLKHYHTLKVTHIPDKHDDAPHILGAAASSYKAVLVIEGQQLTSPQLATFLAKQELTGREVSFIVGGPEGLPPEVITAANYKWSLGSLTLPHDLAMVALLEALYRASTINAGHPYHK